MSVQTVPATRWPQAARSVVSELGLEAKAAADDDAEALDVLAITREHIDGRQGWLFDRIVGQVTLITTLEQRWEMADAARIALVLLGEYHRLETVENERTYEQAMPAIKRSMRSDMAICRASERALGKRRQAREAGS